MAMIDPVGHQHERGAMRALRSVPRQGDLWPSQPVQPVQITIQTAMNGAALRVHALLGAVALDELRHAAPHEPALDVADGAASASCRSQQTAGRPYVQRTGRGPQYESVMAWRTAHSYGAMSAPCPFPFPRRARLERPSASAGVPASARSSSPRVAVIVGMAIVVSNSVADELRRSAPDSAIHNIEAIVRGYLDPALTESSLDLGAPHDPAMDAQLERLTLSGDIRRITIWSRDGRIVYSNVAELRDQRFSIGPADGERLRRGRRGPLRRRQRRRHGRRNGPGQSAADAGSLPRAVRPDPRSGRQQSDRRLRRVPGRPPDRGAHRCHAVRGVRRRARRIEHARRARSGSRSVARRVSWRARTGGCRSRRRPNGCSWSTCSAARSDSDPSSGTRRTASSSSARTASSATRAPPSSGSWVAGPRTAIGRPAIADVHPDDRASFERRLADVAVTSGSQASLEFRARHADGAGEPSRPSPRTCSTTRPSVAWSSTTATSPSARRSRSSSATRRSTTS